MRNKENIMRFRLLIMLTLFSVALYCQPANNACSGAFTIPVNTSTTCVTTLTATSVGATQSQVGCTGTADDDVWFVFTTTSANHTITVTPNTMVDVVVQFFSSTCGSLTSAGCFDATAGASAETIFYNGGSAGTQYYMRVYSYGNSSNAGTFTICVKTIPDPPGTNCINGNQVCSNSSITGNSAGAGSQELTATNSGCLGVGGEINSHWFYLNVGTSGTFQFTVTPSNGSDDYDFAMWGPTNVCPPSVAPIRCNYAQYPRSAGCGTNTNPTGLSGSPGFTSASSCQDRPYLDLLNVTAGEVYLLLVNGFTSSAASYSLSFGGTAVLSCVPAVILPIELISFNALQKERLVELNWATATEKNNDYFSIERSNDGVNFKLIQTIKGAGTTGNAMFYSSIDYSPLPGLSYYRLKQTDYDGKSTYSQIISINCQNDKDLKFDIVPNPTSENQKTNILLGFIPKRDVSVLIYDINGLLIYEATKKIDTANFEIPKEFSKGVYLVKIICDELVQTKRMLIK